MSTTRRAFISAAVAALAAMAVTGCDGSAMGDGSTDTSTLTIGVLAPRTGPLAAIGTDMLDGLQLYIDQHGGKLGGHAVRVVVAEEGDGGATARASVDRLIKQEKASVIVGAASAPAVATAAGPTRDAQIPLIGVGGRPSTITDVSYMWHTSFDSRDYGKAVAAHVAKTVPGPVWVIGPDYQGGHDQISGFVDAFQAAGGKLANPGGKPVFTPYPATANFGPWLTQAKASGAKAVYAFYAGAPAVEFIRQYDQFGLHSTIPLYGPAFLTEGAALQGQGATATGVYTVANYSPDLPGPANEAFVKALTGRIKGVPNVYHLTAYDAGALLDKAIAAAGPNPTPQAINTAIATITTIDSPRGNWRFNSQHTPIQDWYLRQVTGDTPANTMVTKLATVGG
ncbi:ABC transporter substrate-binding protein [Catellatospora methionotrophica]|uniref:ABC transporter substrate-binding protein n=1 Tax=Catellatospora methionotrophica TaxID=121620 RepID=UPI0033F8F1AA